MKRRTLDVIFSGGLLVLAGLLLVAGLVLASNASFANNYVTDQLSQQNITFKTADTLTDDERQADCLVTYAGQGSPPASRPSATPTASSVCTSSRRPTGRRTLTSASHRASCARRSPRPRPPTRRILPTCRRSSRTVTGQRETLFKGETLRGLLLTSYGFSEFGTKAGQAATVAYVATGLVLLLAIAGLLHALVTPGSRAFAAPDAEPSRIDDVNTGMTADETHTGAAQARRATTTGHVSNCAPYQDVDTRRNRSDEGARRPSSRLVTAADNGRTLHPSGNDAASYVAGRWRRDRGGIDVHLIDRFGCVPRARARG